MPEEIRQNSYNEPDRMRVQEEVARAVERNAERFLAAYQAHPDSFGGRYICADLFKETFPQYAASNEARNRYNNPVHNAAAVLSAEQFRRTIADRSHPERNTVVFLTGCPGAGKTSSIVLRNELPAHFKAVFEGQLSNAATAIPKIQQAIDAGLRPVIYAVHARPETALANTFQRFEDLGRGASVNTMATIQGGLPAGLEAIREHFGEAIGIKIFDNRDFANRQILAGWNNLELLKSEGNYEQIKQRLTTALEQRRAAGKINEACYRQASGAAPLGPGIGMGPEHLARDEAHGRGPGISGDRQEASFLRGGAERSTPPSSTQAGTQGEPGSQTAAVRFNERDCAVVVDPPRGSAAPTFRLHDVQTGKEVTKITTAAAQRDPAPGCIHVQNYGEQAGLADALAKSGAFEKSRDLLAGMVVEMKVKDPTLQRHVETHEQTKVQAKEAKPAKTIRRQGPTLERD